MRPVNPNRPDRVNHYVRLQRERRRCDRRAAGAKANLGARCLKLLESSGMGNGRPNAAGDFQALVCSNDDSVRLNGSKIVSLYRERHETSIRMRT
ncbi:MAG: hypothetical protein Q4Q41_03135 [Coriobacteriia bacterium]|nr:hypothetical protein [Coriobacteriia bacterium]